MNVSYKASFLFMAAFVQLSTGDQLPGSIRGSSPRDVKIEELEPPVIRLSRVEVRTKCETLVPTE